MYIYKASTETMVWSEEIEKVINLREQLEMMIDSVDDEGLNSWLINDPTISQEEYLSMTDEEIEDYIPVYINEMIRHEKDYREHMECYHNVKFIEEED